MSNVLIGIIGVILFIGLALAGALFLGPRFQEATQNSKASATVMVVDQIVNAARLYQLQEGQALPGNANGTTLATTTEPSHIALIGGGYLKTVPANPVSMGAPYVGPIEGNSYALMGVGPDPTLCKRINEHVGNGSVTNVWFNQNGRSLGCTLLGDNHVIWERI
ncbi:MAG: hypothetical protein EON55_26215 [Alphaproteobacteria bacterium]|nr:MAG: hypothetical protein EON55_26215 [Alphaproteobacteria bacterium]